MTPGSPLWFEGLNANLLVSGSMAAVAKTSVLEPISGPTQEVDNQTASQPVGTSTLTHTLLGFSSRPAPLSLEEEAEYEKQCEHNAQEDDALLTSVLATEPSDSPGERKGN